MTKASEESSTRAKEIYRERMKSDVSSSQQRWSKT